MLSTNGSGTLAWATASSTVTGLTDTTISSIASGELLKWNGSAWINNTLAEAGIAPVASPTLTGDVTLTGAAANAVWDASDNALEFADNAKATFGASGDLQIYHDGSHSYISDTYTGSLLLLADTVEIKKYGANERMATFTVCLLYTSPSPRDATLSRMPSSA